MHDLLMILHFLGLAGGLGASIAGTVFTVAAGRWPVAESSAFIGRAGPVLSRIGAGGLVVLIISGVSMLILAPGMAAAGGLWFHVKMVFVVLAIAVIGFIHMQQARLRRGGDAAVIRPRLRLAVRVSMMVSTAAVICAVLAFH